MDNSLSRGVSKYPLVFHKAFPDSGVTGSFKLEPEDFRVFEELGFEPSGEGEHLLLQIRKKNLTTETLVAEVARTLSVKAADVGYCGLKDKFAVTDQWLSVSWPIKQPIPSIAGESWQVIQAVRHNKKLRRGIHEANGFVLMLKNLAGDLTLLEQNLARVGREGFPNYFAEQRFGRDSANIEKAERLFAGELRCKPFQRSIYYSAVRSYLFNEYLSLRIVQGNWNGAIEGDSFNLDGSNSLFGPEPITENLLERIREMDIHPVGPLFGDGGSRLQASALALQQQVAVRYPALVQGLQQAGVKTAYRPLRVIPKSLNWQIEKNSCELGFSLPSGSYATALIHQIVNPE